VEWRVDNGEQDAPQVEQHAFIVPATTLVYSKHKRVLENFSQVSVTSFAWWEYLNMWEKIYLVGYYGNR